MIEIERERERERERENTVQSAWLDYDDDKILKNSCSTILDNPAICLISRVFANGPRYRGSIPGRFIPKIQKWYLMRPYLTLSIIRWGSSVNWSNPGKGVAPFPTPRCSSYWKGSLRVTLDYGRQLYLLFMKMTSDTPVSGRKPESFRRFLYSFDSNLSSFVRKKIYEDSFKL